VTSFVNSTPTPVAPVTEPPEIVRPAGGGRRPNDVTVECADINDIIADRGARRYPGPQKTQMPLLKRSAGGRFQFVAADIGGGGVLILRVVIDAAGSRT